MEHRCVKCPTCEKELGHYPTDFPRIKILSYKECETDCIKGRLLREKLGLRKDRKRRLFSKPKEILPPEVEAMVEKDPKQEIYTFRNLIYETDWRKPRIFSEYEDAKPVIGNLVQNEVEKYSKWLGNLVGKTMRTEEFFKNMPKLDEKLSNYFPDPNRLRNTEIDYMPNASGLLFSLMNKEIYDDSMSLYLCNIALVELEGMLNH